MELIGRSRERAVFATLVARLARGSGETLLVAGEPGIGKTRLLSELAAMAGDAGITVVWGRASEVGGAPALWPWMELLGSLATLRSVPAVQAAAGPALPLVARLVPALSAAAVGVSEIESAGGRFLLFDAVTTTLRGLAPLVMILDDLHAADQASLLLLEHASRALAHAPIGIVGSFRPEDAEQTPEVARVLWRIARGATHVPLGRLAGGDAAALLEAELGRPPTSREASLVLDATEGSPLFLLEYARLLRARPGGAESLPTGVRHAIDERLERLPSATREALARASVLGRDLVARFLPAVGVTPEALEPAFVAGILMERPPFLGSFSHILIREALHQKLPAPRSEALHLAVAAALEADGKTGAEVVHHLLLAGASVSPARLVHGIVAAANEFVQMMAFDDAAAIVGRWLADRAWPDALRAELLVQLGSAQIRAGRIVEGKQACIEAAAIARRVGDAPLFARAALYCGIIFTPGVVDARLVGLLEEADGLALDDIALAARIKARLAGARQPSERPAEQVALALEAIALVRTVDDPAALRDVLAGATSALAYFAEPSLRRELDAELWRLAEAAGDRVLALRALARLIYDELDLGLRARAEAHLVRYEALAGSLGDERFLLPALRIRSMLLAVSGDTDGADRLRQQADLLSASDKAAPSPHAVYAAVWRALSEDRRDEIERGRALLLGHSIRSDWFVEREFAIVALVAIDLRCGDRAAAMHWLGQLPHGSWAECQEMTTMALLVEAILLTGDRARAHALYEKLKPYGHRHHSGSNAMHTYEGPYASVLGRLAAGLGRFAEADAWFDVGVAGCRAFGAPILLARVLIDDAESKAASGDAAAACERATEALELARRYRLGDVVVRAEAALAAGAPPVVPSAPPPAIAVMDVHSAPPLMRREGELWAVAWRGDVARFRDTRGMRMLATLLERPGHEHASVVLDGQDGAPSAGIEALDAQAIQAYRARAEALRDDLAEAESFGHADRASRLRDELEALAGALAQGVGLGGRARKQHSQAERARVNVQRRVKDAMQRIGEALPALGRHLEAHVRTGTFCMYEPPLA